MKIKIKNEIASHFKELLAKKLCQIKIYNGCFVDNASMLALSDLDQIKIEKQVSETLHNFIGDRPFYHFVSESISRDISSTQQYESGKSKYLVELSGFDNAIAYAEKIFDDLLSLPWIYKFSFRLPAELSLLEDSINEKLISNCIKIVRVSKDMLKAYPFAQKMEGGELKYVQLGLGVGLLGNGYHDWQIGDVIVQIDEKGFVGEYDYSAPTQRADSCIRSFFGLLMAFLAIKKSNSFVFHPPKCDFSIHRKSGRAWELQRRYVLDDEMAKIISKLAMQDFDNVLIEEKTKNMWMNHCIKTVSAAFGDGSDARRVRLAARWLFDSYATERDLLAFVQAMVSVEILLGHGVNFQETSIGTIIRNRCSYLIAQNFDEREKIISEIKEIYSIRSSIVHAGKEVLSEREYAMLARLRVYSARIIQAEINMLLKRTHPQ